MRLTQPGDVDVQAVVDIDPPCVDDVHTISAVPFHRGGINIEKVRAFDGWVVGSSISIDRAIVMLTEVGKGVAGDLGVDVPIPRQHLSLFQLQVGETL